MTRKRLKHTHQSSDDDDAYEPIYRKRRRPGRFLRRLTYFLIFLAVVIGALPTIIANTPLRNTLVAMAVPKGSVQVSIGGASLGWFSPPSLSGIEVRDAGGKTLLTVESVRVGRTPLALASNPHDLGEIEIQRPTVYLSLRPNGSNLEDFVNQFMAHPSAQPASDAAGSAGIAVEVAVRLVDGTVLAEEAGTGRRWRAQALNVQYDSHGAAGGLGRLALSGKLNAVADASAPIAAGGIAHAGQIPAGGFAVALAPGADGRQQLQWQAEAVTLTVAEPFLQRFMAGAQLGGTLSAQGNAVWSNAAAQTALSQQPASMIPRDLATAGSIRIDGLDAAAPILAGDRVRLARIELPWRLTAQAGGVAIEDLQLRSDLGQMQARGIIDPAVFNSTAGLNAATLDAAGRHEVEVRGDLDLARLAAMLPHALRIRGDTTITSGTVQLAVRSGPIDGGQSLVGTLRTAQLAATSGGKPLTWDQPAVATFDVRRQNGSLRLESLKCDSDFLKIDASGTTQQLTASAEFDLNRLGTQLGQFVDLSRANLAGTGTAHLDWHQATGNQFAAAANTDLSKLHVALGDGTVWDEPRLAIKAEANGALDPATMRPTRVAAATLQLDADGDTLNGQLTEPVDLTAATPMFLASVRMTGNVGRWLTRARPLFTPGNWQIDGQSDVTADVRATAQSVDVANAKAVVSNLHAVSDGWNIQEPRIEMAGDAHWNGATSEVAAQSVQLVSSTVALAAKDVRLRTGGPGAAQASGVAAFRADMARVGAWKTSADPAAAFQARGMVTGNTRFGQQGDRITADLTVSGENLVLAQAAPASGGVLVSAQPANYQTIWQEPQLNLRGSASYEATADRLALQQFQIQSNTLQATADGQIDKLSTTGDINATGTMNYDLAQVTQLLRPYLGPAVQLAGRETARFQVAGRMNPAAAAPNQATIGITQAAPVPHWSRTLQARMEVPWESANVYGLPIGGGKLAAALGDGMVRVDPLAIAVGEGRLTAAPNVRLDPEPMELTLPAGPVLTDVRISPEVSEAMLKYVAPVLAGATQSEGQFSLRLDGARVPLADTKKTDALGQLTVHSVRVTPGPMAKQWVDLAQQIEAIAKRRDPVSAGPGQPVKLLTIQDQQVNFRVVDGRVYHQGMQIQIGDVAVTSEGSVGLDETLSLVLRIPIQDKWIENQKLLAGLKVQSLSIPVTGTLARPQMDQRAIAGLSQQLIQGAAQQAIGGELNKAFDKFLKPRQ